MAAPDNAGGFAEGAPPEERQSGYKPPSSDPLKQKHAQTTSTLAYWLLGMLAGTLALHYLCIMILIFCNRADAIKNLEDFYHSWLPVLAGLSGSVVTYYFTREGK